MSESIPSEINRKLLGIAGMNPWVDYNSASRLQMYNAHQGQRLVMTGMTERYCQTGMEQEFGKYTFSVEIPTDAKVIKIIKKYQGGMGIGAINVNPSTLVIFEDIKTKEVDYVELTQYCSYHQHFGFPYKAQPALKSLAIGAVYEKGTKLLDSPGITPDGNYMYGIELNMALMSHPGASEDGIVMSESALKRMSFHMYETKVVEWGKNSFPINIYGDENNYKAFPDIGEYIKDDNIIMALRSYDDSILPVRQSVKACNSVNQIFDKKYYADSSGGRIIDISVDYSSSVKLGQSPADSQIEKYIYETRRYHKDIVEFYNEMSRIRGPHLKISPKFHQLVVESYVHYDDHKHAPKITKTYKKAPLDDYKIVFTIEYLVVPREANKVTTNDGGLENNDIYYL